MEGGQRGGCRGERSEESKEMRRGGRGNRLFGSIQTLSFKATKELTDVVHIYDEICKVPFVLSYLLICPGHFSLITTENYPCCGFMPPLLNFCIEEWNVAGRGLQPQLQV